MIQGTGKWYYCKPPECQVLAQTECHRYALPLVRQSTVHRYNGTVGSGEKYSLVSQGCCLLHICSLRADHHHISFVSIAPSTCTGRADLPLQIHVQNLQIDWLSHFLGNVCAMPITASASPKNATRPLLMGGLTNDQCTAFGR